MYDAQRGSTDGAYIDMTTASVKNKIHRSIDGAEDAAQPKDLFIIPDEAVF